MASASASSTHVDRCNFFSIAFLLYGVAAAIAFGRAQRGQLWLSGYAAGAFLGYAIGSMGSDQQMGRNGMRLSLTPHSVVAQWEFE